MNNMLGGVLRQKEKRTDIIALICIALLFAVMFLALPYGIGIVDESFYYATAQRVIQGDRLLVDEWQVSQLFSLLLIIPVRIYESEKDRQNRINVFGEFRESTERAQSI